MRKNTWFIIILLLFLFEWMRVYFIMPMPGSQQQSTVDFAYALHQYRWIIRGLLIALGLYTFQAAWLSHKKWTIALLLITAISAYLTNFPMSADHMFRKMEPASFKSKDQNTIDSNRLILGVFYQGKAKAYPINILAYHHQVTDITDPSAPLLATYCSVCRTGMIYLHPQINGKLENLRLVGMDHFNAMFEDENTGSWWQQATGKAVTGNRKGESWTFIPSVQTTLKEWLKLYPNSLILQENPTFVKDYASLVTYDNGSIKSSLLHRETGKKHPKNWVAWLKFKDQIIAHEWEKLESQKIIIDEVNHHQVAVISPDGQSLFAFEMPSKIDSVDLKNPEKIIRTAHDQKWIPVEVHQEFSHSFNHFQNKGNHSN